MFCLLFSAIDPTIEEAVASIIWAEPRLSADVPELVIVSITRDVDGWLGMGVDLFFSEIFTNDCMNEKECLDTVCYY